ncbi:MAG: UvrD-helicase domain-containing protein, partial [Actinomycetota bacterium]
MPPFEPDAQQSRVIDHDRGAMRVRGEAGSGKSTALRLRFLRLVGEGDPERIALVMRSRPERDAVRRSLHGEIRRALPSLNVITVQALARLVLGARAADAGKEAPEILSAADQFALVRELLDAERPEEWPAYGRMLGMRGFADEVRQFLLRAQEAMRTPEDIAADAAARALGGWVELASFYRRYLDVLVERNRVDFAGLVWLGAISAGEGPPVLDHLMVDDFQDATVAGLALVRSLRARSTVVAGNDHAHVFSFQGTTDAPFRELDRHLADLADVDLARRWRGPERVVEAWHAPHVADEHRAIARELRRIHVEDGVAWRDLAVVVRRQGANLASVVRALDDARIPHHVPEGGVTFATESATWPYTIALAWIADPDRRDDLVDALLTSRLAGLSPGAARGLVRAARRNGAPPAGALDRRDGLTADETASLDRLRGALAEAASHADNVADAFTALWHGLDLSAALVAEAGDGGADLDAVLALSAAVNEAAEGPDPSVEAFVRALEARGDTPELARLRDSGADAVAVLTAHATAGREFDTVVIAGAVEGDFPSLVRPEPMFDLGVLAGPRSESARNTARLADERRLFDLVVGRARRRVLLTASDTGEEEDGAGSRSRFVDEAGWIAAPAPDADAPTSVEDAVLAWRRTRAARDAAPPDRLHALDSLLAIGERPSRGWFLLDRTEGDA